MSEEFDPDKFLEIFGNPYDVKCVVRKVEGICPAGYEEGDYFEYRHREKKLDGPKGVCFHCLLHSGVLRIIEHIGGREWPHFLDRGTRRSDGELTASKLCQCQGPEGPTVWWTAERIKEDP